MLKKIISVLKNKYFLITTVFAVWILFFDKNNLISQIELSKKLNELKTDKKYFLEEIEADSINTYKLLNDNEALEKYSRERFRMKRDSEEIFLIIPKDTLPVTEE